CVLADEHKPIERAVQRERSARAAPGHDDLRLRVQQFEDQSAAGAVSVPDDHLRIWIGVANPIDSGIHLGGQQPHGGGLLRSLALPRLEPSVYACGTLEVRHDEEFHVGFFSSSRRASTAAITLSRPVIHACASSLLWPWIIQGDFSAIRANRVSTS